MGAVTSCSPTVVAFPTRLVGVRVVTGGIADVEEILALLEPVSRSVETFAPPEVIWEEYVLLWMVCAGGEVVLGY